MITVDSGITNVEEIKYAEELGINVIVTDHHLPVHEKGKQIVPEAFVVINSKQDECDYHDDMLCGCAVAWKLACAVLLQLKDDVKKLKKDAKTKPNAYGIVLDTVSKLKEGAEKWWLDLVGISTIADMVPLQKENRALAHFGLKVLRQTKRHGLNHIFYAQGVSKEHLTEEDISFTIAPRINAASRMGHPLQAHNMLYEKNSHTAQGFVIDLEGLNNERKGGVKDILATISFDHSVYQEKVVVVGDESWTPGVLGLIAQKIIEETGKPTFVWGQGEDKDILKGSCRSLGDVHVVDLMKEAESVLVGFGGHEQAGGFSFKKENKEKLLGALNNAIERVEIKERTGEETIIDEVLSFDDVNNATYEAINVLAPFGVGNAKPTFSFTKTKPLSVRRFGKKNEHIEVMYPIGKGDVKAIKFFVDEELEEKLKKEHVLVAHIEKSVFRGKIELRLRIQQLI
jgi:single-stranded-DNA-specific exonuclease